MSLMLIFLHSLARRRMSMQSEWPTPLLLAGFRFGLKGLVVSVQQSFLINVKGFFEQRCYCHNGVFGNFLRNPHNPDIILAPSRLQVLTFIFQLRNFSRENNNLVLNQNNIISACKHCPSPSPQQFLLGTLMPLSLSMK